MPRDHVLSLGAIITAMLIANLMYSVTLPLLSLTLSRAGYSETMIGINTIAQPLAALLFTPFIPGLIGRFGAASVMIAALLVFGATLLILPLYVDMAAWFILRPLMGAAGCVLWVASEAWVNAMADEKSRGRIVGIYGTAGALGWAMGPVILLIAGTEGYLPYVLTAGMSVLACIPMLLSRGKEPDLSQGPRSKIWLYLLLAPLPLVANLSVAASHEAFDAFFAIYAEMLGKTEKVAFTLMALGGIAGMISQYPLGWLADRMNRVLLTFLLVASSMACPLLLPYCLEMSIPGLVIVFFWGVVSTGIYTMGTILVGERFRGAQLAGASAAFTAMYAMGVLIGPPTAGVSMDVFGPDGLTYTMIVLYALVLPVIAWMMLRQQPSRPT
ncbi:MAG: MFS transporter [Gammaproteobacteria bacterium]|nr:MFS transporter [Gammaproteobacteria bacterium]